MNTETTTTTTHCTGSNQAPREVASITRYRDGAYYLDTRDAAGRVRCNECDATVFTTKAGTTRNHRAVVAK